MTDTVPAPAMDEALWGEKPKRRRPVDIEHVIQKHVMQFVREELPGSVFLSFDRSAPFGRFSHMRQKARGVQRGTPDTLLRVKGCPNIWCELKAPGNKPDEAQIAMGDRLQAVGDVWFWANSVAGYAADLSLTVKLQVGWTLRAIVHDARVQGEIERAQMKAGKLPARLEKRVSPSRVRRAHAAGVWKVPK